MAREKQWDLGLQKLGLSAISQRAAVLRLATLAGSSALGMVLAHGTAVAQATPAEPLRLGPVSVEDNATAPPYTADKPDSPKYTAPLLDTPQTITVIPEQVIKEQNLMTLRDILSTVSGITFGAGEGGGGYGDSVTLRGYSASTDITLDGVRDNAQYTRSDAFNLQAVEVINGASSAYSGSGSVGGSINEVSKLPEAANYTHLSGGVGTDEYFRGTIDSNRQIGDSTALRLNVMGHRNDVPGRDVEDYRRWGIAPSVTFGLNTDTRTTLSYFHQHDNNIPQYGVPYVVNQFFNGPLPGIDPSSYFGYSNVDTQQTTVDIVTARVAHDFSDRLSLQTLARYQQVGQYSVVNQPQGTICLASGINALTGATCSPAGFLTPNRSGTTRNTLNTLLYDQADLSAHADTFGLKHTIDAGFSISYETFRLLNGSSLRNPNGTLPNPVLPNVSLADPYTIYTGPVNFVQAGSQNGTLRDPAFYVFDTIKFSPRWELNAGARYDNSYGTFNLGTYTNNVLTAASPRYTEDNSLFSYRVGLVYKPIEDASIYVAYGNAKTPSQTSVNGSCTSGTFGSTTFVNNCNVSPETAVNYEIGAKWNIRDDKLALTAALFRNDRTNYKVPSNDPTVPDQQLNGRARVDGVTLGATGAVTEAWQVFANYTYLRTKVLQAVSDFCLANPTAASCVAVLAGVSTPVAGNPLTQTPDHAFDLWTTCTLPHGFQVGYGLTYQGRIFLTNGAPPLYTSPEYWLQKAMVSYKVRDDLTAQVNVTNIFDTLYYTQIRATASSPWALPGNRRQATFTLNYSF